MGGEISLAQISEAEALIEARPYIQKYNGKTVVVKYGGNAMINEQLKEAVIQDIVLLSLVGVRVVVVHGGGPEINAMLKKIGKKSEFVKGLRYTDRETMDIVQMVLCGKVNKDLVTLINNEGGKGIGLCGIDGGLFQATRKTDPDGTDYGYVGEIQRVNAEPVVDMLEAGYIPVISTVAQGMDEDTGYNINADLAASKLAVALQAEKLILLTDVRGLLYDKNDESTRIEDLKVSAGPTLIKDGVIAGGMIPKVDCCVEAVREGVKRANIQDGRVAHSILIELFSDKGVGTMFF